VRPRYGQFGQSRRGIDSCVHTSSPAGTLSGNHCEAKKRAKFLTQLSHFKALDPRFMVAIPPNRQNPSSLAKILKAKGAGAKCYVGCQMGALISCVPGKLGYFEDEDGRCVLERLR
jgi:hypothetical protein